MPLHLRACSVHARIGRVAIAKYLLEIGAKPSARAHLDYTPLHSLCKYSKSAEVAQLLVDYGAEVTSPGADVSCLEICASPGADVFLDTFVLKWANAHTGINPTGMRARTQARALWGVVDCAFVGRQGVLVRSSDRYGTFCGTADLAGRATCGAHRSICATS
jgi:hypothetical protein